MKKINLHTFLGYYYSPLEARRMKEERKTKREAASKEKVMMTSHDDIFTIRNSDNIFGISRRDN